MKSINKEILKLWENKKTSQTNGLMPLLYTEIKRNAILFVGLNPSFSERGFNSLLKGTSYENLDIKTFYAYPKSKYFDETTLFELNQKAKDEYSYFKKFKAISESININWEYVDLFFIRDTSQKNVKNKIFLKDEILNDFGSEQLKLSKRIIKESKPKLIVVANALAGRIFKNEFLPEFNEEKGCHYIILNNSKIPVFLCSMLTGQRAIDNFSYERLKWHIKKVLLNKT